MDVLDLPPPAEPIDTSIPVIPKRKEQPMKPIEIKVIKVPKNLNSANGTTEKKIANQSTDINYLDSIKKDLLDDVKTKLISEKKMKKKKKKKKEKKEVVEPQKRERSPQRGPKIPDIDYEKLAAAETICSDITHPKYKKPFDYGWRRELVFRATVQENQKLGDIYYYTPNGFRLRSMVELAQVELEKGLTLDNFSFFPEPTGVNNLWKETIRAAVFRDKETVARTRKDVRDRLKGVKRKLASNEPGKRMKRRRILPHYYLERDSDSDFDQALADEMLMALRAIKPEKDPDYNPDSKIVMDYDNYQETSPRRIQRNIKNDNRLEDALHENSMPETQQRGKLNEVFTEGEVPANELPQLAIKQEKVDIQPRELSNQLQSNELPKIADEAVSKEMHVPDEWTDIVIKQEKENTQLQPPSQDGGSKGKMELVITNVITEFDKHVGSNDFLKIPDNVGEVLEDETQREQNLGSPDRNRAVSFCNIAVQTEAVPEYQDKDILIDRLQMEIMFLKEKVANLEKSVNSSQVSSKLPSDGSSSKDVVNEKHTESDCDVICVDQYVMNIKYETVDLDSD